MSTAKFKHEIPESLLQLPRDARGYPIPHSAWRNPDTGEYDFRVIDQAVRLADLEQGLCAISGLPMPAGEFWFIGGPSSFQQRLFVDGPMLREVAEFSLRTCPHLALAASQYRSAGLDPDKQLQGPTRDKSDILMLGLSSAYQLQEIDGFNYIYTRPWRAVSWWSNGRRLNRIEAVELLAQVAPEIKMPTP